MQVIQRTAGLLPHAHDPPVAHVDVHLDRLGRPGGRRLRAMEDEPGVAAEETQVGHLAEVERALEGLRVDAGSLGKLAELSTVRSKEIEPEELAAPEQRAHFPAGSRQSATARGKGNDRVRRRTSSIHLRRNVARRAARAGGASQPGLKRLPDQARFDPLARP